MTYQPNFTIKDAENGRRDSRTQVGGRARMREAGCNPFDVELFDLSATGFRVVTFARLRIGMHVWVNLPGLQAIEAVVRRNEGIGFGCEFVAPLHPSVAQHMQATLSRLKS